MKIDEDKLERRCPRLGGQIAFRYCLNCSEDHQPCFKIMDCWWEQFDIAGYLKENLSEAAYEKIAGNSKPQPKIASLLDLIEQAKNRNK
ncbi:MAG: hypothetical protein K9L30_10735 [Desulfobacterales bacterium]|nr:hypothetical protein [Desulfobacterales bacterium]